MGPKKPAKRKQEVPRIPDFSQDLFANQLPPVTTASQPLGYSFDSIADGEGPPLTPGQSILSMVLSPTSSEVVLSQDAVAAAASAAPAASAAAHVPSTAAHVPSSAAAPTAYAAAASPSAAAAMPSAVASAAVASASVAAAGEYEEFSP